MKSILVIGYGNPDREDDGVALHILKAVSTYFDAPLTILDGIVEPPTRQLHLLFTLQLTPEMAESFAQYDKVCFVDAHTGAYEQDVRVAPIEPKYQTSPFTHHLTPESCLSMTETLYGSCPEGLMVSVRGYHFGYATELSAQTAPLAAIAAQHIIEWVEESQ